jgi:hypothetical protein
VAKPAHFRAGDVSFLWNQASWEADLKEIWANEAKIQAKSIFLA